MVADEALLAKLLKWGLSSVGRAPALQAGCHRFESVRLHHKPTRSESTVLVLSRPVGTHRAISRAIYIVQRDNRRYWPYPSGGAVVVKTNNDVVQVKYTNQMCNSCMGIAQKVHS